MFKRVKIARQESKENTFKQPTIKKTMHIQTHRKEYSELEKILYALKIPGKAKTVFRKILALKQEDIDKNIYMIANGVLSSLLEASVVDKLFYSVLGRLVKSKNAHALKSLFLDYLKAQLTIDKSYKTFFEFMIRYFRDTIAERKAEIIPYIQEQDIKEIVKNLKPRTIVKSFNYSDEIYIIR